MTRHPRTARIATLLALCCGLAASAVHAAEEGAVIIDTDRSVVMAGGSVSPSRPIPENFIAAGGRVVVDQPVGKSVIGAGGSFEVRSPVARSVRVAAGSVTLDSTVGNSFAASAGEVRLTRNAEVGGNVSAFGGTITIDGTVHGSLRASAERIIINGAVDGDVRAAAEKIVLGPGARIGGAVKYASASEIERGEGATIAGPVSRREPTNGKNHLDDEGDLPRVTKAATIVGTIVSFLALLGCGALFLSVAPIFSVEAPDRIQAAPGRSLGFGLLTVIGVPVLAVMFVLTIVGIPVGAMLLMLYPLALLFGFMVATLFVCNAATKLAKLRPPPTIARAVAYYAVALVAVLLVSRIPTVGGLILFLLIVMGAGAFANELWLRMKKPARPFRTAAA